VSERPLLLLDVDGVLLPVPGTADPAGLDDVVEPVPGARDWLAQLRERFDIAWATSWVELANRVVAPALDLPPLPAIPFSMDEHAPTPKLRSVIDAVGDRPCAWVDDDMHEDANTWAAGRDVPTLLVHVDGARGLDRQHVQLLLGWAAGLEER
jgi:hypothetical protein